MIVVVMGVSGAGKTTIGTRLARQMGWPFYEGDEFHPPANIAKMTRGQPLTDADRRPWLAAVGELIARLGREEKSAVIACSALKQKYRRRLAAAGGGTVRFVHLVADAATIRARLTGRPDHFMDPDLLASQFDDLEEPRNALAIDATQGPETIVREIRRELDIEP